MFDKHIRVLIVDPVREQSLLIEKMLNFMGHYCVATTTRVEEGLLLSRYGLKNFDALIAPQPVLLPEDDQSARFKGFNIRNLFLYSCPLHDQAVAFEVKGEACFRSGLPEYKVLEAFMGRLPQVEPANLERTLGTRCCA